MIVLKCIAMVDLMIMIALLVISAFLQKEVPLTTMDTNAQFHAQQNVDPMNCFAMEEKILVDVQIKISVCQVKEAQ